VLLQEYQIEYDARHHRIRCQGHIINLVAHAFIFITDSENLEAENETPTTTVAELKDWRTKGPVGKLHNLAVDLARSVQHEQKFKVLSHNRGLPQDNGTRWNSWQRMIGTAIVAPVKDAIVQYFREYSEGEYKNDELTDDDWEVLEQLNKVLAMLKETTLALEGCSTTLDNVLPAMDFILGQLEQYKIAWKNDARIASAINNAWAKMEKYYRKTDETPVYVAALVLDPKYKWGYIEKNWPAEWHPRAKQQMQVFWETKYKPVDSDFEGLMNTAEPTRSTNSFTVWKQEIQKEQALDNGLRDEYVRYCKSPREYPKDTRQWWLERTQQMKYPNLARMALNILSVPAMSDEPERLFSSAGLTLTNRRNRAGIDLIEALEQLKSWYKIKEYELEDPVAGK
jgi:hAT family C-terminal dimerisation region